MTTRGRQPEHDGSADPDSPEAPQGARLTDLIWVEPALSAPSGGQQYNRHVVEQLRASGTAVDVLQVEGAWPVPTRAEAQRLRRDLARRTARTPQAAVVVDGLVGSCTPELFGTEPLDTEPLGTRQSGTAGTLGPTVLLVHLPLTTEQEIPQPAENTQPPSRWAASVVDTEAQAVHSADVVVATSSWTAEDLRRRFGRKDIEVISPGVHPIPAGSCPATHHRCPSAELDPAAAPQPPYRLTMAAAFNPVKNHLLLGSALAGLGDLDWELTLAGPGGHQGYGADVVAQLRRQLPGRIRHLGAVPPEQMTDLWSETDLLLLPSWAETYGMVIIEACAHGVPAVASSGTGAVEALGEAGAAREPSDPEAWAQILRAWMQDSGLRRAWAQAARRRRGSLPTWAQTANRWRSLLGTSSTG